MKKSVELIDENVCGTIRQNASWRDKVVAYIFESGYLNPDAVATLLASIVEDLSEMDNHDQN